MYPAQEAAQQVPFVLTAKSVDKAFDPPISQWNLDACLAFLSPSDTCQRKLCGSFKLADIKHAVIERLQALINNSTMLSHEDVRRLFYVINVQYQIIAHSDPSWHSIPNVTSFHPSAFLHQVKLMHNHLAACVRQPSSTFPERDNTNSNATPHDVANDDTNSTLAGVDEMSVSDEKH